uniref:Ubiquitin-like protease family profile domain-containing protein n=1 Tax=Chenopodium quinoa TaxID=63459 RepID=A0A803KT44_CHEQI
MINSLKISRIPLICQARRLVLFAVNDNDESGGSHWSTLVYDRMKNLFMHYDSMQELNSFHAMKLYDAVKEYMGPDGSEVSRAQISSTSLKKQENKKKKRVQSELSKPVEEAKSESVAATGPAVLPKWCSNQKGDMISAIQKQVDDSVEVNMQSEVLPIIQKLAEY